MTMTIYTLAKLARTNTQSIVGRLREGEAIGEIMWNEIRHSNRAAVARLELDGWPECECTICVCSEPATTTDDGGVPVCAECAKYVVDAEGDVHCARHGMEAL